MKKDKLHIHWYPGHIAKAERKLKEQLSLVDAVIEVIDARLPYSSSYGNITRLLGEKPRLILLNKSDLADKSKLKEWIKIIEKESGFPVMLTDAKNSKDSLYKNNIPRVVFECNFYNDTGSKPIEVAHAYANLQKDIDNSNLIFIWVTDGQGWEKMSHNLMNVAEYIDFIVNYKILDNFICDLLYEL